MVQQGKRGFRCQIRIGNIKPMPPVFDGHRRLVWLGGLGMNPEKIARNQVPVKDPAIGGVGDRDLSRLDICGRHFHAL